MAKEVMASIEPLAKTNQNTLKIPRNDGLGTIYADRLKLRQCVLNLLCNACKFTKGGTISLEIDRETIGEKAWIYFDVGDTDIGMTPVQMEHLFEVFSQAGASTHRVYGGTGLGLAISQSFCKMMGGEIAVQSEVDIGSTFTIRLPAQVVRDESSPIDISGKICSENRFNPHKS